MKCFICELNVPSLPSLVYHYKIIHLLGSFNSYTCFKKHILNKHVNSVEVNLSETTLSRSDTINYNSISSTKLNEETFETNNCIEELHLGAVKFCLKLHNNNNICKSDVQNIQSDIENIILNPIIKLLMGIIQKETEYLLNNWLKINEFISYQYKQYTINNEVNLISKMDKQHIMKNLLGEFVVERKNNSISK
ncbi:C2H2-type domain-containing protein [Aphis craccivora]|uniref:C2H2-type domain-containing protein n=1 Tax=Aphis craccivora TaxID=307492 RepID=A0A6G0WT63_APHCR|nr:C2H2-type domain-containing protein [Aphis craccivora]